MCWKYRELAVPWWKYKIMGKDSVLTKKEKEIIELIVKGLSNKQIGELTGITEGTVKPTLVRYYPN